MLTKFVNCFRAIIFVIVLDFSIVVPAEADEIRLSVLGDSLVAGYGLSKEDSFPKRLEVSLKALGYSVQVLNAGVSGDTTAGGKERLNWILKKNPHALVVALAANDGLRGLDPELTYHNLRIILEKLRKRGIPVLLCGAKAPPNLGKEYGGRFNRVFPQLAKEFDVQFYPFFLEGIAAVPSLNQVDGIHPNPEGVNALVERILSATVRLVERAKRK